MDFFNDLVNNSGLKILIILVVLDTIFGILRAIKEKNINSTIGIDGVIRKCGMLISVLFFCLIDNIVNINLIGFIPQNIMEICKFNTVELNSLFIVIYALFEILSILKNMILCKLPIPHKLQEILEKAMNEFTGEIKKED